MENLIQAPGSVSPALTTEQINQIKVINTAYEEIVEHLSKQRDHYVDDVESGDVGYYGITKEDAFTWLVESF